MSNQETQIKEKEEIKVETKNTTPTKAEGEFKIKSAKKMKNLGEKSTPKIIKVDLTKTKEDAVQKQETNAGDVHVQEQENKSSVQEVVEEIRTTTKDDAEQQEIDSPLQEITDEESNINENGVAGSNEITNTVSEQKEIPQEVEAQKLPENIEKLIKFMKDTGGDVNDYARLNADYTNIDSESLLHEYYKTARPHLNAEERGFIIEDSFHFDEELDEARDIRKKKLAYKEEVAKAKNYLEGLKTKYYDEIKLRPGVTQDQQKATDFFNRFNEEKKAGDARHVEFIAKTKSLLNNDFKGFDFKVGEKKFRYGIKDPSRVGETQVDVQNFVGKYSDDKGNIVDPAGYHKAMYAAMNADKLAHHFYEQGKADGVKDVIQNSKNPSQDGPRQVAQENAFVNGLKVKSISGLDSSKLKIKKRKFN